VGGRRPEGTAHGRHRIWGWTGHASERKGGKEPQEDSRKSCEEEKEKKILNGAYGEPCSKRERSALLPIYERRMGEKERGHGKRGFYSPLWPKDTHDLQEGMR